MQRGLRRGYREWNNDDALRIDFDRKDTFDFKELRILGKTVTKSLFSRSVVSDSL